MPAKRSKGMVSNKVVYNEKYSRESGINPAGLLNKPILYDWKHNNTQKKINRTWKYFYFVSIEIRILKFFSDECNVFHEYIESEILTELRGFG